MTNLKPRPYESGDPVAEYNENVTGDTAEAFGQSNVVPVIVTDPVRVEAFPPRYITTDRIALGETPVRVVPTNRHRASVTIRNNDTVEPCLIGGPGLSGSTGFLLNPSESITLTSTGEVWALDTQVVGIVVSVLSEYRDA